MKKKIVVRGPVLSQSGYGEQARFALRSIRTREDVFDIYLIITEWGGTGWIWRDDEERRWIDDMMRKSINYIEQAKTQNTPPQFDISLQVTIPQEFEKLAPVNVGYTAGTETTKMSPQWVEKSNLMDKILVTSKHTKYAFDKTSYEAVNQQTGEALSNYKCETPVEVVSYPVRKYEKDPDFKLDLKHDFNFLCMAQWSPRKNIENTITGWLEEFWDQEVGLILKGNIKNNSVMDREYTKSRLKDMLGKFKDRKCSVYLLHGDMTENELSSLYQHPKVKCFINLAHGEGFGLPVFEAAYYGLPVVAPDWGGILDFMYAPKKDKKGKEKEKAHFAKVDYDLKHIQPEAVWDPVLVKDSQWAFPRQGSYKMTLRKVFKNYGMYKSQAERLQDHVIKHFDYDKMHERFVSGVLGNKKIEPISISGVSFCIPTNGKRKEKTDLTIKSIAKEMGNFPHEIILCGDIESFKDREGVKLIEKKEEAHTRKVASLRNEAAKNSSYDVIAWCDDDIIIGEGWLKNTLEYSSKNGWDVLGNKILNPDGTRHWDRATLNPHVLVDYDYFCIGKNLYQTSGFFLSRKKVFKNVEWDESKLVYADRQRENVAEDVQYTLDLYKNNIGLCFNSGSVVWHNDEDYTEFKQGEFFQTIKKDFLKKEYNMELFPPFDEQFEKIVGKLK